MKGCDMKRGTVVSVLCEVVSCHFNINKKNASKEDILQLQRISKC